MKIVKCKNAITVYTVQARRPRQYDDNVSSRNVRDFFLKKNENEVEKVSLNEARLFERFECDFFLRPFSFRQVTKIHYTTTILIDITILSYLVY